MTFLAFLAFAFPADPPKLGLSLPPGFEVSQIAGDELVHDAFVTTVHPKGHILVGGRGYLRVLVDANNDGRAESQNTILARPDLFPMGLWWTDKELLFVSDRGVWSLPMDGLKPKGPPTLLFEVKARGEHDAHAVKRGPDGWLYLMCGNMAGIDEKWAADVNSPVKKPVAGCLVRISHDGKRRQVVCDGFRNAYDFDWNSAGDPFTYDSDNERCVSLPWYEGCRLYHMVAGANHGWQSPQNGEFWRKPPYFFDVAEPLADLGRGSPTGVVCYKHKAFPPKYRDGLFLCDWTFGKIYFAALTPSGASYDAKVEVFAKPIGDEGFAPVSAAVHPLTGDLLVTIGGRGTRGAVYRIRYSGEPGASATGVSRIGSDGSGAIPDRNASAPASPGNPRQVLERFYLEKHPAWDAARTYLASSQVEANGEDRVLTQLKNRVSGWMQFGQNRNWERPITRADAFFLKAMRRFTRGTTARGTVFEGYSLNIVDRTLPSRMPPRSVYTPLPAPPSEVLDCRDSKSQLVIRELKRFAALTHPLTSVDRTAVWSELRVDGSLESWSARWVDELAAEESVPELVHTLICLARCPLPEGSATKIAAALLSLDDKLEKAKAATDRNWPLRIGELHQALAERLPTLNEEMVRHPSFGRPAHALFASGKSFTKLRKQAAERLLAFLKSHPDTDVTTEVVKLIATLPADQIRPTMVRLWERHGLRDELTNFFARKGTSSDAGMLVEALNSPRVETVEKALAGLERMEGRPGAPGTSSGQYVAELLAAAERSATIPKTPIPKKALNLAGRIAGLSNPSRDDLVAWLKANDPAAHAELQRTGVDWPEFQTRLTKVSWEGGDAERGKRLYEKLGCTGCHMGSGLGPDLKGVGSRFSRDDLFRAIVDPNKDVSDRYRTTQVLTKSGAVKIGLVIYEAADGLLLQTAPAEMVRIPNDEIEEQRLTRTSIMPSGLLKETSDQNIADLATYLKSLK